MSEEIPRYLALTNESDAMYDERIKALKCRVPASESLKSLSSKIKGNKAIDHSNKYGLFVHCMEKDIGIKSLANLNEEFTLGKQEEHPLGLGLEETPIMVSFSPTEEHLAVLTLTTILIIKVDDFKTKKVSHTIKLEEAVTDIQWTQDNGILYWKFESKAFHYSLSTSKSSEFKDIKCCSAQLINNHYILTEEFILKIFDLSYTLQHTVQYPDEAYTGSDFYGINMEDIISIIKLNNLESNEFKEDDMYAFI